MSERELLRDAIDDLCRVPEIDAALRAMTDDLARRVVDALADGGAALDAVEDECRFALVQAMCIGMGQPPSKIANRVAAELSARLFTGDGPVGAVAIGEDVVSPGASDRSTPDVGVAVAHRLYHALKRRIARR